MGDGYDLKCKACDYGISVIEGIGMLYSPDSVFYGRWKDEGHDWRKGIPDGCGKWERPLLFSLIEDKKIRNKAFGLLANGAVPKMPGSDGSYGHRLYVCPECCRLANRFYFKLVSEEEEYEPDYRCSECDVPLCRVKTEYSKGIGTELVRPDRSKVKWKCPECGGGELGSGGGLFLWD